MTSILIVSGSLRAGSFNTALANAAAELAPEGVETTVVTLHGIPLYDGDIESSEGIPHAVLRLKRKFWRTTACCWPRPNTTTACRAC